MQQPNFSAFSKEKNDLQTFDFCSLFSVTEATLGAIKEGNQNFRKIFSGELSMRRPKILNSSVSHISSSDSCEKCATFWIIKFTKQHILITGKSLTAQQFSFESRWKRVYIFNIVPCLNSLHQRGNKKITYFVFSDTKPKFDSIQRKITKFKLAIISPESPSIAKDS